MKKLIIIYQKQLIYTSKLQKSVYKTVVKLRRYAFSQKI